MLNLPLFYYPSTITWVDDDSLFINAASQLFQSEFLVQSFHHPEDCLKHFDNYSSHITNTPFLRACVEDERFEAVDHSPVDLNVPALYKFLDYAERTKETSVIIVDYNMPVMNGIELCKKLNSLPMKKILLTGEADHREAVSAFNDNIIDRFLRKDSQSLVDDIQSYVKTLSQQYFSELTNPLLTHLEASTKSPLSDPVFIEFFRNWCHINAIKEYSVIDKNGSFLVINNHDNHFYFVVHTNKSLDAFIDLNDDTQDLESLLVLMKNREKIPFFGIGNEYLEIDPREWNEHFYTPNILEGREKYYWAVVERKISD